jgi:hypothetical protein
MEDLLSLGRRSKDEASEEIRQANVAGACFVPCHYHLAPMVDDLVVRSFAEPMNRWLCGHWGDCVEKLGAAIDGARARAATSQ